MSREHMKCRLIEKLCKKLMNTLKRSRNPTAKIRKKKHFHKLLCKLYIITLIFSEFMRLKNPDRGVSLVNWSRVITSLPGYRWAIKCGQHYRMGANGY